MIVGSGMTGLETAEVVLQAGHKTTVVDMLPQIGAGADMIVILDLKERMAPHDPVYLPGHRLSRITAEGVELERVETGQPVFVPASTVILAHGRPAEPGGGGPLQSRLPRRARRRRRGARRADPRGDPGRLRAGVRVRTVN